MFRFTEFDEQQLPPILLATSSPLRFFMRVVKLTLYFYVVLGRSSGGLLSLGTIATGWRRRLALLNSLFLLER